MNGKKKEEDYEELLGMSLEGIDTEEETEVPEKPKKGNKKLLLLLIGGTALLVAVVVGIVSLIAPKPVTHVETTNLTRGNIETHLDTSGTVNSTKTKTYFSPVNAPVNSTTLKVGDTVTAGQELITFDTSNLEQDNKKAQLTNEASSLGNQDTINKANEATNKAANAKAAITSLQANIKDWQNYIADLNTAIADRTRELTSVAAQNSASLQTEQNTLTKLQNEMGLLAVQVEQNPEDTQLAAQYQQKVTQVNAQSDVVTSLTNQISHVNTDPSTDETIISYNNEIASAQNTISELQTQLSEAQSDKAAGENAALSDTVLAQMDANSNLQELEASSVEELLLKGRAGITSDFAGVISRADGAVNGALVTQGMELVTVSSTEDVAVDITIAKNDYDKVKEGQNARVTIGDKEYDATVTSIGKIATTNEKGAAVLNATVTITNPDADIFLGVEAKVVIDLGGVQDVLTAPVEIVNTGTDGDFVYVIDDGVVAKRLVETGISDSTNIEIASGLQESDVVIPNLPDSLSEGMAVQAMTQEEKDAKDAYNEQINSMMKQVG